MGGQFSLVWGVPFVGLVLTIAASPSIAPAFWSRHYGKVVLLWALAFVVPDIVQRGWRVSGGNLVATAIDEYIPFVLLLATLYIIAGGLRISGAPRGTPAVNTAMLGLGTLLAGAIGTPGASLLMLRPMIRANRHRQRTTHVYVFYILLVANIGGAFLPDRQRAAVSRLFEGCAVLLAERAYRAADDHHRSGTPRQLLRARALPAARRPRRAYAYRDREARARRRHQPFSARRRGRGDHAAGVLSRDASSSRFSACRGTWWTRFPI